jgi:DNA-binding Xre family transcriptional regulator
MNGNGSPSARELYSGLRFVLEERNLTVADLAHRVAALGEPIDVRTLQRLADPDRPLKLVDARVVERVCRALGIDIGDFLALVEPLAPQLSTLPPGEQGRLDELMDRHSEGELHGPELDELRRLVEAVGESGIANAQRLLEHRERVRGAVAVRQHSAAD